MQNKKIALIGKWRNFVEQLKISKIVFFAEENTDVV